MVPYLGQKKSIELEPREDEEGAGERCDDNSTQEQNPQLPMGSSGGRHLGALATKREEPEVVELSDEEDNEDNQQVPTEAPQPSIVPQRRNIPQPRNIVDIVPQPSPAAVPPIPEKVAVGGVGGCGKGSAASQIKRLPKLPAGLQVSVGLSEEDNEDNQQVPTESPQASNIDIAPQSSLAAVPLVPEKVAPVGGGSGKASSAAQIKPLPKLPAGLQVSDAFGDTLEAGIFVSLRTISHVSVSQFQ